jgi:hypothetical protein
LRNEHNKNHPDLAAKQPDSAAQIAKIAVMYAGPMPQMLVLFPTLVMADKNIVDAIIKALTKSTLCPAASHTSRNSTVNELLSIVIASRGSRGM